MYPEGRAGYGGQETSAANSECHNSMNGDAHCCMYWSTFKPWCDLNSEKHEQNQQNKSTNLWTELNIMISISYVIGGYTVPKLSTGYLCSKTFVGSDTDHIETFLAPPKGKSPALKWWIIIENKDDSNLLRMCLLTIHQTICWKQAESQNA